LDIINLTTRERSGTGKSYTRKARAQGWVPAIYYGHNFEPVKIEVNAKEFAAIVRNKKQTHLINLGIGKTENDSIAVIRETQKHVIKDNIFFHIDFMHVAMNEKVIVEVPLEVIGTPIGVKEGGGVLGHPILHVKIECMPANIPEKVTIDVSSLNLGQSIHVRDVSIPNVTIKESPDEVLAVVTHPTRDAAAETAAAAAEAAAATTTAAAPAKGAAPAKAKK